MSQTRFNTPQEFVSFLASNGGSIGTDRGFESRKERAIAKRAYDECLVSYAAGSWGDEDWYVLPKPKTPSFLSRMFARG